MRKYERLEHAELLALRQAIVCYISELDWSNESTAVAQDMLEDVLTELGERFNEEIE